MLVGFVLGRQTVAPDKPSLGLIAEPVHSFEPAASPLRRSTAAPRERANKKDTEGLTQGRRGRLVPVAPVDEAEALVEPAVETPAVAPQVTPSDPLPEWVQFADRGEYNHAYKALEQVGGFDGVVGTATAEQLMILVDIARANGQRAHAISALRSVTRLHSGDPNAPVAAMMLGKMLMRAGDQRGAAEAFSLYRRLSPMGDFAEDALARSFDAALEQGDLERARQVAKQYESDFPDGRRLDEMLQGLAAAEAQKAAAADESDQDGDSSDESPEAVSGDPYRNAAELPAP
jgi:outer membrane protein assembly factor BamD (BamD/ComL family)